MRRYGRQHDETVRSQQPWWQASRLYFWLLLLVSWPIHSWWERLLYVIVQPLRPENDKYADQRHVFEQVGLEILQNAWDGYHCCLFAYGQTGAGKSYSMVGYGANKVFIVKRRELCPSLAKRSLLELRRMIEQTSNTKSKFPWWRFITSEFKIFWFLFQSDLKKDIRSDSTKHSEYTYKECRSTLSTPTKRFKNWWKKVLVTGLLRQLKWTPVRAEPTLSFL